jgi:hypothetical protein
MADVHPALKPEPTLGAQLPRQQHAFRFRHRAPLLDIATVRLVRASGCVVERADAPHAKAP